jgi:hypothetical protein
VKAAVAALPDGAPGAGVPAKRAPLAAVAPHDTSPVTAFIPVAVAAKPESTPFAGGSKAALSSEPPKGSQAAKPASVDKKPKTAETANADKARKPKLVRDSFTIPKPEYAVIEALKLRAARLGHPAKKSEVLRAGIKALLAMSDEALLASLVAVPRVKTGRPAKD